MVPLPNTSQLLAIEVFVALVRCMWLDIFCAWDIWLEPCARRTAEIALKSEHWPAVFPCDRSQCNCSSDGMEIHHEQCIPLSSLGLYDASLVNVGASCCITIDRSQAELASIRHDTSIDLCERSSMIAKCLVSSDSDGLVWTPYALRTRTESTSVRQIVGRNDIVHTIYFICMMTLAYCIALRYDDTVGLFNRSAHVRLELSAVHFSISVNGINLAIIIE